jgi:hypothetical protein
MKQEDKDLLLKDLCSRLPYGVKCRTSRKHGLIRIKNCVLDCHWLTEVQNDFYKIKPYLFPLSSMTEEQEKEWRYTLSSDGNITYETVDWCNKNHFDYRGLIEKSLALDATNLGIYE